MPPAAVYFVIATDALGFGNINCGLCFVGRFPTLRKCFETRWLCGGGHATSYGRYKQQIVDRKLQTAIARLHTNLFTPERWKTRCEALGDFDKNNEKLVPRKWLRDSTMASLTQRAEVRRSRSSHFTTLQDLGYYWVANTVRIMQVVL